MDADLDLLTRRKGCQCWEFPRESTRLCCTLQCNVKIPKLEITVNWCSSTAGVYFQFISGALAFFQCLFQANHSFLHHSAICRHREQQILLKQNIMVLILKYLDAYRIKHFNTLHGEKSEIWLSQNMSMGFIGICYLLKHFIFFLTKEISTKNFIRLFWWGKGK